MALEFKIPEESAKVLWFPTYSKGESQETELRLSRGLTKRTSKKTSRTPAVHLLCDLMKPLTLSVLFPVSANETKKTLLYLKLRVLSG